VATEGEDEGDGVITRYAPGDRVTGNVPPTPSSDSRRLRLIGAGAALVVLLAGCASSPEASRVPGEPGADVGNHGNPVVLLEPLERVDRVYYDVPYDGPAAASADTSQS
jgi:hypothetical protein